MRCILSAFILVLCMMNQAQGERRVLAAMMELSGQFAKGGEDCKNGVTTAEFFFKREFPNSSVAIKLVDHQGVPRVGLSEIQRLIADQEIVTVLSTSSPVAMAIAPILAKSTMPLIGVVGHPDFITTYQNAIRVLPSTKSDAFELAQYAQRSGFTRAAIVTLQSDYFTTFTAAFKQQFLTYGRTVYDEEIDAAFSDVKVLATRIKASKPDVVLINLGPNQLPHLIRELKNTGVFAPLVSNFLVGMKDIQEASHGLAGEVSYVTPQMNLPGFIERFKQASEDLSPSPLGFSCFLGTAFALQTIERLGNQATRERLSKELVKTTRFSLLGREFSFSNREIQLPVVVTTGNQG